VPTLCMAWSGMAGYGGVRRGKARPGRVLSFTTGVQAVRVSQRSSRVSGRGTAGPGLVEHGSAVQGEVRSGRARQGMVLSFTTGVQTVRVSQRSSRGSGHGKARPGMVRWGMSWHAGACLGKAGLFSFTTGVQAVQGSRRSSRGSAWRCEAWRGFAGQAGARRSMAWQGFLLHDRRAGCSSQPEEFRRKPARQG
jgi:hypothetical protein